MHERNVRDDHPTSVGLDNNATNLWKRMWNIKDDVEDKLRWIIRKGDVDIALDKWKVDALPLDARGPVHSLFLSNKKLDNETSFNLLGITTLSKSNNLWLVSHQMKISWFEPKQVMDHFPHRVLGSLLEIEGYVTSFSKKLWHPLMPLKISFLFGKSCLMQSV